MSITAFQANVFQINAYQTGVTRNVFQDLDKGGHTDQMVNVFLGHSLGWVETYVKPVRNIIMSGIYTVDPGNSAIIVDITEPVTLLLPSVEAWLHQPAYRPATAFNRSITVRGAKVNHTYNIRVIPFGHDRLNDEHIPYRIKGGLQPISFFPKDNGWFTG